MDWQQTVSLMIVVAAAALLLRSRLRRQKPGLARVLHCDCAGANPTGHSGSIVYRARKGERPQVIIRPR